MTLKIHKTILNFKSPYCTKYKVTRNSIMSAAMEDFSALDTFLSGLTTITTQGVDLTTKMVDKASSRFKSLVGPMVHQASSSITFESIEHLKELFEEDKLQEYHASVTTWIAKQLEIVREQAHINRQAISGIFTVMKEAQDEVNKLKETITKLEKSNVELEKAKEELAIQLDETKQRSLKGQLIVSTPSRTKGGVTTHPIPRKRTNIHGQVEKESDLSYVSRLISLRNRMAVDPSQVSAVHGIGPTYEVGTGADRFKEYSSFVIVFKDWKAGSNFQELSTYLTSGKNSQGQLCTSRENVFINFQLTPLRQKLAKAIREARWAKKIERDSVNENGQFKVKVGGSWRSISTVEELEVLRPSNRMQ